MVYLTTLSIPQIIQRGMLKRSVNNKLEVAVAQYKILHSRLSTETQENYAHVSHDSRTPERDTNPGLYDTKNAC
jgi:hypothetical protein